MWNVLFPVIHHDSFSTNDVHLLFPFCFFGFLSNFYSMVPDVVHIISFRVYRRAARYNQSSTDGWLEQNRVCALLKPPSVLLLKEIIFHQSELRTFSSSDLKEEVVFSYEVLCVSAQCSKKYPKVILE